MKFFIKHFFSKYDQICSFLQNWPQILKKSLMENFSDFNNLSSLSYWNYSFFSNIYWPENSFFGECITDNMKFYWVTHYVKSIYIRSFSGPYFPAFGLHTERYGVKYGKMPENTDQKNSEYGHFLRSDKRNIFNWKLRLTSLPNVLMSVTLVNVSGVPRKIPYNIAKTTIPQNLCKTGKMDMQTALQERQMVTARFWSTL